MIGNRIEKTPFKVLLATIVIFALLIAGAVKVNMATGSETLVDINGDVYISNKLMEENFGGDSILVLFEGERENLLSIENIGRMWNIEQRFKYEDKIFSFMSTASIIHQMTDRQSLMIKDQILTISNGLSEVSSKLKEVGTELASKDIKDPKVIEEKLADLSNVSGAFDKLIQGQRSLSAGVGQLQGGLFAASEGLTSASGQLAQLSNLAGENQELKMKLIMISENIGKSADGLMTMANNTTNMKSGADNTAKGLTNISSKLSKETSEMKAGLTSGINPVELKQMAEGFVTIGENLGNMSQGLGIFHSKSSMMVANIPTTQEELDTILYDEDLNLRAIFDDVIVDDTHNMMVVKLQGNLEDKYKDIIYEDLSTALEKEGFENISFLVSGKPVLDSALRTEMKSNMKIMVALAVALMFIILLIVFHVRWRVLSLGIIFVSVIATLGFMGTMSVPMTMVSMAVFPILIGLGIDYSIQLQNRYEEEKSVRFTLIGIGKSVAIAVIATVLGFISLYASPVPMIKDFGKMLTIGVIISFIGSILLLMPILHIRDTFGDELKKAPKYDNGRETRLDKILKSITRFVLKYSIFIIIISIAIGGFGFSVDNKIGVETDIETFMPQDMAALSDIHQIRDIVGSTNQMAIYMEGANILSEENINWINNITADIKNHFGDKVVDVKSISTLVGKMNEEDLTFDEYIHIVEDIPKGQRRMFLSDSGDKSVILMNISHMSTEELKEFVLDLKDIVNDAPMGVEVTGKSVLDVEMVKGLTDGRVKMTVIGLVLVFMSLLLVYRNIIKAFIPIFPIILIIGMSAGIMYFLGIKYTPITATLGALVLGMGTEMTIMLLERYIEERVEGKEKIDAMLITVSKIGKATIASGLTTIGGFSVLMASKFVILKDFGLMTVINISLALISTFIILPTIIILLDRFIVSKKVLSEAKAERGRLSIEEK